MELMWVAILGGVGAYLLSSLPARIVGRGGYSLPIPRDTWKKWPPKGSGIAFGYQRSKTHVHQGVDIGIPVGTPVLAIADGVIEYVKTTLNSRYYTDKKTGQKKEKATGPGYYVVIRHNERPYYSWYMHLDSWSVKKGDSVRAGDEIGRSGKTLLQGRDTSPHLHLEVLTRYPPGKEPPGGGITHRVDPEDWLRERGIGG